MFKIIDRYITVELIKPFIMVIFAFIVVMISIRLGDDVDKIIKNGIPYQVVIKNILSKVPDYIVKALPIAYLVATLLTTSRFSRDHETTALRSSGVKFKRLMFPIILVSIFVSFGSFLLNEKIVPITNKYSQKAMDDFERSQKQGLSTTNVYFRGPDNRFFHIQKADRDLKNMENLIIVSADKNKDREIVVAKSGNWKNNIWNVKDGVIQYYLKDSDFVFKEEKFDQKTIDVKANLDDVILEQKNPDELSAERLKEIIDSKKSAGFQSIDLEVEYYMHYARACATFFSATISAPVGFIFARLGSYIGVALSIILIFIYYVAEAIGKILGINALVDPYIAAWSSNIVFAFNGLIL
ncbi:MAG: LptF/LptG family permease, partial [Cyanobacteriota bacterium]